MRDLSDKDLIGMLDSGTWLARGGSVALGCPGTLRKAICQAHMFSADGSFPTEIIKISSEELHVASEQIRRLWDRIRPP